MLSKGHPLASHVLVSLQPISSCERIHAESMYIKVGPEKDVAYPFYKAIHGVY